MPGERIGNSNQYLTISGVVSAPAYSWASDNDTGLYRIGANNIGIAANGTKVLDISNTAVTITPATTLSAAITYGGITLSNAVTGTGNMVLSASPTLTGTLTAATITASGAVTGTAFIPSSATVPANGLYLPAANTIGLSANTTEVMRSTSALTTFALATTFSSTAQILRLGVGAAADGTIPSLVTMARASPYIAFKLNMTGGTGTSDYIGLGFQNQASTATKAGIFYGPGGQGNGRGYLYFALSSAAADGTAVDVTTDTRFRIDYDGSITSTGAVTGTLFTPTATGTNGLGLAAANTPAFYASTTEVLRATTALITAAKPIKATGFYTGSGTTALAAGSPGAWATISAVPAGWAFFYCASHTAPGYGGTAETFGDDAGSGLIRQATYNNVEFQVTGGNLQGRLIVAGSGLTLAWSYLLITAT